MKLATLKNNTRDGQLVIVSKDLTKCIKVPEISLTLQNALDDWTIISPKLVEIYNKLNTGKISNSQQFEENNCESPLPRAYQWADGSAYLNHVELVRKARNAVVPESFYKDPLMYQGGSDTFIGPRDDISLASESWGIDMEAEIAIITDDVPMGVTSKNAAKHIKLIMLVNDVSLRNLIPAELAKGFGFFQSKASSGFSPVCVTPDELDGAWKDGKLDLFLDVKFNNKPFGLTLASQEMTFGFNELISHAARSRSLGTGTIIGSGTVSNKLDDGPGKKIEDGGRGYSCIAEIRMIEIIQDGEASTEYMKFGDNVKISMNDKYGNSVFGLIDQTVVKQEI